MLELKYKPIDLMYSLRYKNNAKEHDIGALMQSIQQHGFREPVGFDDTLGAIVSGNGRVEALWYLYQEWVKNDTIVPDGIVVNADGMWEVPVVYGVNAANVKAAIAWLIDANNLTMAGGHFTALDMARAWDMEAYLALLAESRNYAVSVDEADFQLMLQLTNGDTDEPMPESTPEMPDEAYHYVKIAFPSMGDRDAFDNYMCDIPYEERGMYLLDLLK